MHNFFLRNLYHGLLDSGRGLLHPKERGPPECRETKIHYAAFILIIAAALLKSTLTHGILYNISSTIEKK